MKRFTLLFAFMFICSVAFSQKIVNNTKVVPVDREMVKKMVVEKPSLKTEGEVFYLETFDFEDPSAPRGWTLPDGWNIVDENDYGHYWTWRAGTDSIKGRYTFEPGHIYSKTPEDGYFVLPMDEYNAGESGTENLGLAGFAWFQMAPIDCSAHSSVIMKLRQYYRSCCSSPNYSVFISNDEGVHWAEYSMIYGTGTNVFCKKPIVEVNISEVAAGMPNVWIKFVWNGNSHYFWCIDDFELSEGYVNELQLEDEWVKMSDLSNEDNDEGYVFMTPLSQINGVLGGWTFDGAVINSGTEDQYTCQLNAEIWKNGTSVHTASSPSRDIWSRDRDTFYIADPYFPDGYGTYKFKVTASQEQEDAVPENNVYEDMFNVTDSVYSVADWDFETYSSTASWGNNDGDYLGILYDVTQACEVNSMSVLVMQREQNPQASTQIGYGFQYFIFQWNEAEQLWTEKINGPYADVTEENLNTWITLEMEKDGESEFMEPGQYIAAIQVWHGGGAGPDNNIYRFTIGSDLDHKYATGKTLFRLIGGEDWATNSTDLSMIRMNLNYSGAPSTADVTFNVDMTLPLANGYFHTWDFVDVAGTFNDWAGSAHMEDLDGDGIYTLTISDVPVFEKIEYKYRINGNWDTSEFPSGGPNRSHYTAFWNNLDDVYNNGISMAVDVDQIQSSIRVYPNPSQGLFTLDVENPNQTDLNILVTDIKGQVVFQKVVKSVLSHQETIDLTQFTAGMYFLKVNDQVTKLMVN